MRRFVGGLVILIAISLVASRFAAGDVFVLTNGGRVEGEVLNPDQLPRRTYQIKTAGGARITLAASQVKQIARPVLLEYEEVRPTFPNTVEGQWELAEWCRQHGLLSERETHLERVIELDPNHAKARAALGYSHYEGRWKTQKEAKEAQGYVWHSGRWQLRQEIELIEENERIESAEGRWMQDVKMWQSWLDGNRARLAQENLRKIDDPLAVKALVSALQNDSRDQARILFIEALAGIRDDEATMALAAWALEDPIEEVRLTCLDHLKEDGSPLAVEYFIGELTDTDNRRINRAAVALREMDNPVAIRPLIDALITAHKQTVRTGNPGQMTTSFSPDGRGPAGLAMGGGGTTTVTRQARNRPVLDALVALSGGVNFGFDVARWKAWHASQQRRPDFDARRD